MHLKKHEKEWRRRRNYAAYRWLLNYKINIEKNWTRFGDGGVSKVFSGDAGSPLISIKNSGNSWLDENF